ncbi:MAG: MoaD/ThiS family protein [Betaproteobacteria bacterium]|nr:MoaD/ThiS family protein [Betaproteobacteria bacterium]
MKVTLPTPLIEYTSGNRHVEAGGRTLSELLDDLDRQYPGIRFRMVDEQGQVRPHMRFFVNRELQRTIDVPLKAGDAVLVVAALSGG